ncbi:MAG: hypothetical protein ACXVQU_08295 [Actinomycetota bacterium]
MRARGIFIAAVVITAMLPAASARATVPWGRYAIGDSVMLGARDQLVADGFRVNAVVSRQFRDGPLLVRQLAAGGHLPRDLIVHLGTNGLLEPADCDAIVRAAGPDRHVFLVTDKVPRPYRDPNNARLRACAHRHRNATVIDWYGDSRYHAAWFYPDGYHLTPPGRVAYAAFLDRSVRRRDAAGAVEGAR